MKNYKDFISEGHMSKAQAEKIVANADYMPWPEVRNAKEILGYDLDAEDREAESDFHEKGRMLGLPPRPYRSK